MLKPSPEGEGFNPTRAWDNKGNVILRDIETFAKSIDGKMIDAYTLDKKISIDARKIVLKELNDRVGYAYTIHKWAFIAGMTLIILSRASYYYLESLPT